ncbi:MAG TPA: S9 family peptidase [Blastocatellia bacterium]|nr:S9 family peptidase [Blastocatellia bacterium]
MKKLMPVVAVYLCLLLSAGAQTPRPMTFDDVMALRAVGGTAISPDGKTVAYTVSYAEMKENERLTEIWLVRTTGGKPRRFTSGKNDISPQWSPDGQWIAFISTRSAASLPPAGGSGESPKAQIYLIPPFGGEAEKLTDSKTGVSSFAWSPDGKRIAYVAQVPLTEAEEKKQKDKDDAQVIDANFRFTRLWSIEVESKKTTEIVKDNVVISDPQWSPDGRHISYTAHPTPKADDGGRGDIYIASADGSGKPRKLYDNAGPDSGARWSPDGKWISFSSRDVKNGTLGFQRLYIISAEGGTPRAVAPNFDGTVPTVTWSRDGSMLYFQAGHRTTAQLFSVPAAGGEVKQISSGEATIGGVSFANGSGMIAFTRTDLQHPADVYVSSLPNFNPTKLTDHNPQLKETALGRSEVIRWKSKDGLEIEGILIYPVNYEAGKRYPLLAGIHGGPSGVWTQSFPGAWGNYAHVWAGKGWAVFLPNVRGSSGYGEKFLLANVRDWGGGDYQDIQSGLDDLIRRGIADPDKLGQAGWSYGGYMTAWTLTQTNRFKAVMVGAGLTNMFSMYSTNDLQTVLEGYFGAQPWDDLQAYARASAMTFIKQAKTPTLILHGGNDQRVPVGQAQELYMGLRKNNVPVQLVFFPREGHGLTEPRHQLDKMKREYAWFAKYVLGIEQPEEKKDLTATAEGNK